MMRLTLFLFVLSAFGINNQVSVVNACGAGRRICGFGPGGTRCCNCGPGKFGVGSTSCISCYSGSYQPNSRQGYCLPCAKGTVAPSRGRTACDECAAGRYALYPFKACRTCGVGKYSSARATTCQNCTEGTVAAGGSESCTACVAGEYVNGTTCTSCGAGQTSEFPFDTCIPDPSAILDGGMSMDPHIQKFDGSWYDYNGECDLVLISSHGQPMDFDIHVRTTIRYLYSYIQTAAIRIGNDILEVSGWGEYALNGVNGAMKPNQMAVPTLGGFRIHYTKIDKRKHSFVIGVNEHSNITFTTFKDFVNIHVHMDGLHDSAGLMGDFATGKSLARDGKTVLDDPNEFGQEWQVLESEPKLFMASRDPQAPFEKCRLAKKKSVRTKKADAALQKAAEERCLQWAHQNKDSCVADIVATGDIDLAESGIF